MDDTSSYEKYHGRRSKRTASFKFQMTLPLCHVVLARELFAERLPWLYYSRLAQNSSEAERLQHERSDGPSIAIPLFCNLPAFVWFGFQFSLTLVSKLSNLTQGELASVEDADTRINVNRPNNRWHHHVFNRALVQLFIIFQNKPTNLNQRKFAP